MKVLLDTHFLIWLINDPAVLQASEREVVAQADAVCVSAASLWELRIKWHKLDRDGQRKGVLAPADALHFCNAQRWHLLPLAAEDSVVALDPPVGHRDPFDEMLLVHARQHDARLLTRDRMLRDHPLAVRL